MGDIEIRGILQCSCYVPIAFIYVSVPYLPKRVATTNTNKLMATDSQSIFLC